MKRFFLLIVLVMMVSWIVSSHRRSPLREPAALRGHRGTDRSVYESDSRRRAAVETRQQTRRALAGARQAIVEARDEVRQAFDEARDEVHHAFDEVRVALVSDDDRARPLPPVPPSPATAIEEAPGLPVPIVPGTRVTEAELSTPSSHRSSAISAPEAVSTHASRRSVTGQISATNERALADARRKLRDEVATWLDPEVPRSWALPTRMLDAMVVGEPQVKTIQKDYGELFEATLTVDASNQRRTALIEAYTRQLVEQRLAALGAMLVFVLICLAAVSGYIRADEATKGYYTNRLRMLAAAGVGASGVLIYHMVV